MPRRVTLSLYGLYQYDPTILDGMSLPTQIDADVLKTNLLMETAELEVVYPDAEFMKMAVTSWSSMMIQSWQKQADVLYNDYDPFKTITGDETRTITEDRDLQNQLNVNAWDDQSEDGVQRKKEFDTGTVTTTEIFHRDGNSALNNLQDTARKELNMRIEFEIHHIIINDFKQRFCLMVY